jgi:hypothetical protein
VSDRITPETQPEAGGAPEGSKKDEDPIILKESMKRKRHSSECARRDSGYTSKP